MGGAELPGSYVVDEGSGRLFKLGGLLGEVNAPRSPPPPAPSQPNHGPEPTTGMGKLRQEGGHCGGGGHPMPASSSSPRPPPPGVPGWGLSGAAAPPGGFRALLSPERGGQRQGLRGQGDPTGSAQGSGGGGEGLVPWGVFSPHPPPQRDFPAVLGVSPPPQVQREQELQGRLRHRHVLRLHGHLATRSHLYLLLELCGRRSLADILRARGVLTEPEARYYLRQGGEGLSYLHGQGLVHRDLKPTGNVLVTERMQVKIGDLGLARPAAVGTRCWGALCGTPAYMAPEVLDHKGHGVPSDIWAWGCIMYEVLTGSPPFEAAERQELYGRIRTARYPLPPSLSPRARALLGRLLLPDPTARAGLGEVLEHGFFTQGFTPDSLPPHACRTVPVFCLLKGAVVALARRWVNWEHWDAATRPPPRSRFLGRSSAPQPWAEENLY
ncbi:inactive serine/threonine-protein kinase PLK5-like isoform X4 [Anas platyrhynchos]|uniref:inactive serine/threonine-protein kinase PLK5-like isoform X4 n=1 Tax=Anas platyrhynchos TaxID=8839 RepID=UPI003AF2CEDF